MKQVPEEVQRLLKQLVEDCETEDSSVRDKQLRTWRQMKLLWEGFQRTYYSEVAHDWRIVDDREDDQAAYDKPINVFRAYLESIIAALSVTVPAIKCYPDDATNTLDLLTAKSGDKIAELIYRHNNVSLLWLHALFLYCTEGMVACHSYPKSSEEYGEYSEKNFGESKENHEISTCPQCGMDFDDRLVSEEINGEVFQPSPSDELNELDSKNPITPPTLDITQPDMMDPGMSELDPMIMGDEMIPPSPEMDMMGGMDPMMDTPPELMGEQELCPQCQQMMTPEIRQESFVVTRLVDEVKKPKTRMCLDAYGGLHVKVPNYAKDQKECAYLNFSEELDYTIVVEKYEHLHGNKKLIERLKNGDRGPDESYAQWARLSPQYQGEFPANVVTVSSTWLRPAKYNMLVEKAEVKKLRKLYPDGVKVVLVNGEFAEAVPEALDDYWTLTHNPLSDYIHFDPLGLLLVSIQEITNDLNSLTVQTIEHGVGLVFADPAVLNFKAFEQTEVTPGGVFPATPKSNKSMHDAFFEVKTATLSGEVLPFSQHIQTMGQLASGSSPTLFGGALSGSETASEYSMSRAQSLQRLQNTWKMFTVWWKTIHGKAIPMYIKEIHEDERDVQRTKDGNFINVLIKKGELEGRIGKIELEANENLPLTWSQKKDVVMQLLQAANPQVLAILANPENLPYIREAIGLPDMFIPGEDDRDLQYDEIRLLLDSEPIPTGDPEFPEVSSVEVDELYNNHTIHFEVVRKWAISEEGQQTKIDNEPGYRNVLLHGKIHSMMIPPPPMPMDGKGSVPNEKPNDPALKSAPITGESNVSTV